MRNIDKDYIARLIKDIEEVINEVINMTSKPFKELTTAERYAIRYSIIVVAEALTALALHIARRAFGAKPETPIHTFRILRDKGLLTPGECGELEKIVRLRNLLVHRYWVVDDKIIYDSIKRDFKPVLSFIKRLRSVESGDNV